MHIQSADRTGRTSLRLHQPALLAGLLLLAGTAQAADGAMPQLSPWAMYQQADVLVKGVILGLLLASIVTWTIGLAKLLELLSARRRLATGWSSLRQAGNFHDAVQHLAKGSVAHDLLLEAQDELAQSGSELNASGIKERIGFRLQRQIAACGRRMGQGTGILASIGATAPFVGLFGTVWGIMNSFIGIAQTQTSNLAVVAPGIAEALLATAMGLFAAIPAVVIYNLLARATGSYKAQVADAAAQVLLLVSRELDRPAPGGLSVAAQVTSE